MPNRLFFSVLPGGELEFSCIVVVPGAARDGVISWALRGHDNRHSLTLRQPLTGEDLRRGRALISAVLPQGWPDSALTVDLGQGASEHEVRVFGQHQGFILPFASDALVVGGHRIGEPHRAAFDLPGQQFGWDLVALGPQNLAFLNGPLSTPPRSTDLACYGQHVLAPAPGIVVAATDGIPDAELLGDQQPPAGASLLWAAGNHVVIRHDHGVHSFLAHLQKGSVDVAAGQQVQTGTLLGSAGSSGNANGPHLHLHFMDGPDPIAAAPLPIQLTAEGDTFAPTSGQIIGP